MEETTVKDKVQVHKRPTSNPASSNGSLIDWDKNVLEYVYSCMHPEPYRLLNQPLHDNQFLKSHRRIVSATSPHAFHGPAKPSRLLPRPHGHMRNASDPGMRLFFPPTPLFFPAAPENRNISNVEVPVSSLESIHNGEAVMDLDGGCRDTVDNVGSKSNCLIPCLQPCANSVVLLICLCAMAFVQAMVSSGYLSSIITTLERRFDLTSRQVGYMYSCYEVTSVLSTIGFSFLDGQRQNRPRIIGLLGLALGLGFGLFALPHWLSGPYSPSGTGLQSSAPKPEALCSSMSFNTSHPPPPFIDRSQCNFSEVTVLRIGEEVLSTDYTIALPLFCCAMALAGLGSSSLFVLAPTYFWDNLSSGQYPIYSGFLYSFAGLGPAFGFIAGAAFLQIYVDAPNIKPPPSLDAYSPSWLGAWWLGMVAFGALACLIALPVITFPRNLAPKSIASATNRPTSSRSTTLVSTPVNDAKPHPATGDMGPSASDLQTPVGLAQSTADGPVQRYPETIPEAVNESLANRTPTTATTTEDLEDCKVHRRPSSKVGISRGSVPRQPSVAGTSSITSAVDGKKRRRRGRIPHPPLPKKLKEGLRGRFGVFLRVISNPIWLGVTGTTVTEQTIVSAYLTYAAKYLQAQFRIPAHLASIHTGAVVVPSAVLGVLTGALMMRQFRPSIRRALFASLIPLLATLGLVLVLMFGLGCSTNHMAGVTATYDGRSFQPLQSILQSPWNLTSGCNSVCRTGDGGVFSCPLSTDYNPVCWHQSSITQIGERQKHMSFLNPCLAGCSGRQLIRALDGTIHETYTNCNCVTNSSLAPDGVVTHSADTVEGGGGGTVTRGVCDPQCPNYIPFLIVTFITIFLTGINQNPSNVITLSCVDPDDGTAALGLQVFFARTLAFIPTPIYFGMLMDRSCLVRTLPLGHICTEEHANMASSAASKALKLPALVTVEGACLEYDVYSLPYAWLGGVTVAKCLSIVIATLTWRYAVRHDRSMAERPLSRVDSTTTGDNNVNNNRGI